MVAYKTKIHKSIYITKQIGSRSGWTSLLFIQIAHSDFKRMSNCENIIISYVQDYTRAKANVDSLNPSSNCFLKNRDMLLLKIRRLHSKFAGKSSGLQHIKTRIE